VRRLAGFVLFVAGGLLASFAGGRYAIGAVHKDRAWRAWNEAEARATVARARSMAVNRDAPAEIALGSPVARLIIPRLGMDEIVLEGLRDQELNAGPGRMPGSAFPGEPGNAVISAHRDRHFSRLGAITVGDTIRTQSGRHDSTWIVISKRVIGKETPALFWTEEPTLTLTTCWPIRFFGSSPERLIVTAKQI
jgi:sortase A